jgi:hypothetical protein
MFDEKSIENPNFDNLLFLNFFQMKENKKLILKLILEYYVKCNL